MSQAEHIIRNLTQPKVTISDRLYNRREGVEAELRVLIHKGSYYLAVKGKHNWHYFKEDSLD
jgi:hypothetical protein